VETLHIEPGWPWQKGSAESPHLRLRGKLLDAELFADLRETCVLADYGKNTPDHRRPHSSLEILTPAEFALSWGRSAPPRPPISHCLNVC